MVHKWTAQSITVCQVTFLFSSGEYLLVLLVQGLWSLAWRGRFRSSPLFGGFLGFVRLVGRSLLGSGSGWCGLLSWCWSAVPSTEGVSHRGLVSAGLRLGARGPPTEGRACRIARLEAFERLGLVPAHQAWCLFGHPISLTCSHEVCFFCRNPFVLATLAGARIDHSVSPECPAYHALGSALSPKLCCKFFSVPDSFLWFSAHLCNVTNKFKVGIWLTNGARRASRNVTVHRLSAYSQDLLLTARLHDSRLYQAKRAKICCAHHPCIDRPILCCLLSQHTHNPSWSTMGLHFAHGGGADWLLYLAGFTALHHDVQ